MESEQDAGAVNEDELSRSSSKYGRERRTSSTNYSDIISPSKSTFESSNDYNEEGKVRAKFYCM